MHEDGADRDRGPDAATACTALTPAPTRLDRSWQVVYRAAFPLVRIWWGVWRRPHVGSLVAVRVGDSVLLVASSYRAEWNFPGGGVKHGEAPEAAARRELAEEVGLVAGSFAGACAVRGVWDGRPDHVHIFELRLDRAPALRLDNREIIAARLFTPGELGRVAVTGPVAAYFERERAAVGSQDG